MLGASVLLALGVPLRRAEPSWGVLGAMGLLGVLLVGMAIRRVARPQTSALRWAHGQDLIVVALLLPAVVRCDVWLTTPNAFRVLIWGYGLPGLVALGVVMVRRALATHRRSPTE